MPTKVAVISGGVGAVGQALALALAREGYAIAVLYRGLHEEDVSALKKSLGDDAVFIAADVNSPEATAKAIKEVATVCGRIDVAIHAAAGKIARKRLFDLDAASFQGQLETSVLGAFNLFKPVAEIMKGQKSGVIIGITSAVVEPGAQAARMGAYAVGKFALRGLLRELHRELAPDGIRVLAVAPDLMKTPLNADLPDKYFEFSVQRSQAEKLMTPQDVAASVLFLLSGEGSTLRGASLLVSSGAVSNL
jgi:NAD(P)-dependent dehydrogenase (short-subunit alcohol dehydrogenase family)